MKIVRYKDNSGEDIKFGALIDSDVYHLKGDPIHSLEIGD